jgi:hypothetical protein
LGGPVLHAIALHRIATATAAWHTRFMTAVKIIPSSSPFTTMYITPKSAYVTHDPAQS